MNYSNPERTILGDAARLIQDSKSAHMRRRQCVAECELDVWTTTSLKQSVLLFLAGAKQYTLLLATKLQSDSILSKNGYVIAGRHAKVFGRPSHPNVCLTRRGQRCKTSPRNIAHSTWPSRLPRTLAN